MYGIRNHYLLPITFIAHRSVIIGHRSMTIDYCSLTIDHWLLIVDHRSVHIRVWNYVYCIGLGESKLAW